MASAFSTGPVASVIEATRPSVIRAKYSTGPKVSASAVIGAANAAISAVAMVPAANEPSAAIASATPARPRRAIW